MILKENKNSVVYASEELKKSRKAQELMAHHKMSIREFIQKQLQERKERRDRRSHELSDLVLATLLYTFDTPKKVESSKKDTS